MRCWHDCCIDLTCADCARNSFERLHRLDGNAIDVDVLDAGNLLELIERGRAERTDGDRSVCQILEFVQPFVKTDIGGDDFVAFVAALFAHLARDGLDQALAGQIKCSRCKGGETKIGGARRQRFCHHLIGLVGGHPEVEAFGFEVTFGRSQKKRTVVSQSLRADNDALLRGGGTGENGNRNENRNPKTNHRCRLTKPRTSKSEYEGRLCAFAPRPRGSYFRFPQKRWMRRQASSRSSVLVA